MIKIILSKLKKPKQVWKFLVVFFILISSGLLMNEALSANPVTVIISAPLAKSNNLPSVIASGDADVGSTIQSARYQIYPSGSAPSGSWYSCTANNTFSFGNNYVEYTCLVASLPDGSYKMNIESVDNNSLAHAVETSAFIVDRIAPVVYFDDLVNAPNPIDFNNPVFTGTVTDSLTNVSLVQYKWALASTSDPVSPIFGDTGWTNCDAVVASSSVSFRCNPGYNFPESVKGDEYRMHVRGVDEVNNISTFTNYYKFQVDTVSPYNLAITYPNATGITLYGNHSYNITWVPPIDAFELLSLPIKIEYSSDGTFASPTILTSSYSGTGPYSWTVPSDNTASAKIRITATDLAGNSMTSTSANPFTVVPYSAPSVNINPISNDATDTLPITITANASDSQTIVSAEYSVDGGGWSSCSATDGSYGGVSEALTCGPFGSLSQGSHTITVRAYDLAGDVGSDSYGFIYDISNPVVDAGYLGTINLPTAPGATASDSYSSISSYSWSQDSGPGSITFSNNNILNPNISANTVSVTPYIARLTVCDILGHCDSDTVSFTWTDQPLNFNIIEPSGGERLAGGSSFLIQWSNPGGDALNHFDIEYSINGGANWTSVITGLSPATVSYSWTIPNANSETAYIRVNAQDSGDSTLLNATSNVFAIDSTNPTIDAGSLGAINTGTAPGATASDNFDTLGQLTYAWTKVSGPSAIIFGGGANILNPNISSTVTGSYVARLTVTDRAGNSSTDTVSFDWDGNPPNFSVSVPAAAANLRGTSTVQIIWTVSAGAISYKLEYTIDNGSNFTTITASTNGTATSSGLYYNWTLPAANSSQSYVRVTASDTYSNTSSSNSGTFTIDSTAPIVDAGSFPGALLSPTQSTGVAASDSGSGIATYAWTQTAGVGTINFGGGANILSPAISADASGIYTARLTVTDRVGYSTYDEVSFLFNTDPTSPWITAPAINAYWSGGVNRDITWTMATDPGDLSGFTIDYSINNGVSWSNIGTLIASTSRLINWSVPVANSTTSLVRVIANDISGNKSTTTNQFTIDSIAPVINIGSIGTTTVATTSGATVTDNIDGPSDLTYLWSAVNTPVGGTLNFSSATVVDPTMSGTASGNYTAQLIAQDRAGHITTSLLTFYWQSQPGAPVITTPNAATFSQGGAVQNINWTMTDVVDLNYFDLSYSLDNGSTWNSIATTTAASRTYAWSVPGGLNSTNSLIKIDAYDIYSSESTGTSSTFTIDSVFPIVTIGNIGTTTVAVTSGTTASDNIDGPSDLTYAWSATSVPVGGILGFSSSSIINPLMSGTVSGNYTAELTVTDRAGHSSVDSLTFYWQGEPDVPVITNPNISVFAPGGSIQNIDWTLPVTGDLDYFTLSYSLNNGGSWSVIATTTPSSRIYAWSIPGGLNSTSSLVKIDALDIYGNQSTGTSSNFTIDSIAPVINIGSISAATVATTSGTTVTDNIDGPSDLTYVWTADNVPNGGTLVFTPSSSVMDPAMAGTVTGFYTAKLTVTDRAGHSTNRILVFYWQAAPGTPIITNPTDTTYAAGGATQRIDWFLTDVVDLDHFNMSYSIDNGLNWILVTSTIATSSRTYNWSIPGALNSTSSVVKIDAYDIYNSGSSGVSPIFIIDSVDPVINIGSIGTTTVATTSGTIVTDNIDNASELTYSWTSISTPVGGTLVLSSSTVMDPAMSGTVSGNYTTQLSARDRAGHVSTSLLTFYWQGEPDVPVISSPNVSTFVKGGVTQNINWTIPAVSDLDYFNISYSLNDGISWTQATSSVASTSRTYTWSVPVATNSTSSLIKIDAYDIYNNYSVGTSSKFTIDSVNPVINIGSIVTATVATTSATTVTDNIDSPSDLTYSWSAVVVPGGGALVFTPSSSTMDPAMAGTVTGNYTAQLTTTDRAGNSSTSALTFYWQAEPGIPTVTNPTDATFVKAGTVQNINWFIDAVDLDYFDLSYSINNGVSWTSIATTSAASRTYTWTVPGAVNSTISLIKVDAYDINGVKSTGTSANFTIDATAPVIIIGSLGRISTATTSGTTATDNIDSPSDLTYLWSSVITPGGGTLVLSSATEINPTFAGTVSGSYTANLYVEDRSGNISTSPLTFFWEGEPDLPVITNPTSTVAVKGGVTQTISWTIPALVDLNHFDLSYSTDEGSTWNSIVNGLTAGVRTYAWTVPSALNSTSSKVRVIAWDNYNNQSIGTSVNFTIDSTKPVVSAGSIASIISSATSSVGVLASDNFDTESNLTFLWTEISKPNNSTLTIASPTATSTLLSGDVTGDYQVLLSATDRSGNIGTSTLSFSWLSINDPIVTVPVLAAKIKGNSTSTIAWTIINPGDLDHLVAEYSINNGSSWNVIDNAIASSSLSYSWPVADGVNSTSSLVRILSVDTLGNIATGTSPLFTIDSSAPTVDAGSLGSVNTGTVSGATASDNFDTLGQLTYAWSASSTPVGGTLSFSSSSIINPLISGTVSGNYTAELTVTDRAGNSNVDTVSFNWNGDPSSFSVSAPAITANLRGSSTVPIIWTVSTGAVSYMLEYTIDNGSNFTTITASTAGIATSTGRYYDWTLPTANSTTSLVRVIASDTYGNISSSTSGIFAIDSITPTVSAGSFSTDVNSATAPGATASDNFSSINEMNYIWTQQTAPAGGSISFGGGINILNPTLSGNVNGSYIALLTVSDLAGNASSSAVSFTRNVISSGGGGGGGGGGGSSVIPCTTVVYGDWGACFNGNGIQYRSIVSSTPNQCNPTTAQQASQSQSCSVSAYCTEVTYGEWGACSGGYQHREVNSQSPANCILSTAQDNNRNQTCSNSGNSNGGPFDLDVLDILEAARAAVVKVDENMVSRVVGKILIQVEDRGKAWYVNPVDRKRYYLGSANNAFSVMSLIGQGISNKNLRKIPIGLVNESLNQDKDTDGDGLTDRLEEGIGSDKNKVDSDGDGFNDYEEIINGYNPYGPGKLVTDPKLLKTALGHIYIQVETNGEAWYVEPTSKKRYYLGRPTEAYGIMRQFGLGITNADLNKIPVGQFTSAQVKKITQMLEARNK